MHRRKEVIVVAICLALPIFAAGCGGDAASSAHEHRHGDHAHGDHGGHAHRSHDHHDHGHASTGPHGGRLIELGHDHKYHAELVEDAQARLVCVYILDGQLRELPITAQALTLHLTENDQPASFELHGAADDQDAGSSRFASTDASLLRLLAEGASVMGKLRVTIDGVPYVGRIANREGHAHRH